MATNWNRREAIAGLLLSAPGAAAFAALLADAGSCAASEPPANTGALPRITISKETTYITEPLRTDGYPDYIAALNRICSRGVTPENNAAVLVAKAMGPGEIGKPRREEYAKRLGISPLPESGDYFRPSSDHVTLHSTKDGVVDEKCANNLWEQLETAKRRPWPAREYPVWAEWLRVNEQPMVLLSEASRRPRRYDPWFWHEDTNTIDIAIPMTQYRDTARAFALRAALRIHDSQTDAAWEDMMVCHRLARLLAQGPTMVESLVAITVDAMVQRGECALLGHAGLTAPRIAAMYDELASLPSLCDVARLLDLGERFFLLADLVANSRKPAAERNADLIRSEGLLTLGDATSTFKPILDAIGEIAIDWDIVLRMNNAWVDRRVKAIRNPSQVERKKATADIDREIRQLRKSAEDVKSLKCVAPRDLRKVASERLGAVIVVQFYDATSCFDNAVRRTAMRSDVSQLAFALARYHADHGSYPELLADLSPKYVASVPKDIFANNADLRYIRQGDGYLLYSVGLNGRDDGGKGIDDHESGDETWDDIAVRMPASGAET